MQIIFDYIKNGGSFEDLTPKGDNIVAPLLWPAHEVIREYIKDYGVTNDEDGRRVVIYFGCANSIYEYRDIVEHDGIDPFLFDVASEYELDYDIVAGLWTKHRKDSRENFYGAINETVEQKVKENIL